MKWRLLPKTKRGSLFEHFEAWRSPKRDLERFSLMGKVSDELLLQTEGGIKEGNAIGRTVIRAGVRLVRAEKIPAELDSVAAKA